MKLPKILIARAIFSEVVERLKNYFDVTSNQEDYIFSADELNKKLQDQDGLMITADEIISRETIIAHPQLKVIANMAVGYSNIDVVAATVAGIKVSNTPDVLTETTADFAWALLMAAARRVNESEQWLRSGKWDRWRHDAFLGMDVYGRTLGIVGMGRIGQAVARRAAGFGMRVLYCNRSRLPEKIEQQANCAQWVSKEILLRQSDYVVLTVPYSAQTYHLIGAQELAWMKNTAILVNVARGGVVDDHALITALKERRLGAAGLDVFENEPALHTDFLSMPNVVLTPHIASASLPTRLAMAHCAATNLIIGLTEREPNRLPPNCVNMGVV